MNPFAGYEQPRLALDQPVRHKATGRTGKVCGFSAWCPPIILYGVQADDLTRPFDEWYSLSDLEFIL